MRILITGSLGVLGRPLGLELARRGHEVWGCDNRHAVGAQYIRTDVAEYRQLQDVFALAKPHIVYHLAAEFGRHNGEAYYEQLWKTAMIGTRNVLELCNRYNSRLAFASSSEVYGETEAEWLDEGLTERQPIVHPNEYALSKWANERQILSFVARHPGMEAMRLRFFNAYGPGEEPHPYRSVVALFCHLALRNKDLPVFRNYHRTFMHINDFIPTLANVAERFKPGMVVNIGGEDYRSVEELASMIVGEVGKGRIDIVDEDKHNVRSKRPKIDTARDIFGHDPKITLEWGVPNTVSWMREHMFITGPVKGEVNA